MCGSLEGANGLAVSGMIKKCTRYLDSMEIKHYVISIDLRQKRVNLISF